MDQFVYVITGTIIAATPLIYAGLGELVVEKSGVLNLGIEGMMLVGAVVAFYFVKAGYPHGVAVLAALVAGAASSLLFGVLALTFLTNQYAAGLALAIFGSGVSGSVGRNFGSAPINALRPLHIPVLSDIPILGPLLFSFDYLVYLAFVAVALVSWVLYRTKTWLDHPHDRRIAAIGARDRLSGDPHSVSDYALWRCDGRSRRGLSVDRLHAALGAEHDRRQGVDRTGPCRFFHLAAAPSDAGRVAVRRHDHPATGSAGSGIADPIRPPQYLALCRHHRRAGRYLAQPSNFASELSGISGKAVSPQGLVKPASRAKTRC